MTKSYYGSWTANNGASFSAYDALYESDNKYKLAQEMRAICLGNTFSGNTGKWAVFARNNNDTPVLAGTVRN